MVKLKDKPQKRVQYIGGGYTGKYLTLHKTYLVLNEDKTYYVLRDNYGNEDIWKKEYFKEVTNG